MKLTSFAPLSNLFLSFLHTTAFSSQADARFSLKNRLKRIYPKKNYNPIQMIKHPKCLNNPHRKPIFFPKELYKKGVSFLKGNALTKLTNETRPLST